MAKDIIENEVEKINQLVEDSPIYGAENQLLARCLKRFPFNLDVDLVAMKIGLIDVTNSTHLALKKSLVNVAELAKIIVDVRDVDERIKLGDPDVVNEIARANGTVNLFSFTSKYCCFHNRHVYGKDDYSIYDSVLKENLPLYFDDVKETDIERWRENCDYKKYNDFIGNKLNELNFSKKCSRYQFDQYVWYVNKKNSPVEQN